MKKLIPAAIVLSFSILSLSAADKNKMLQDLDVIKATFETKYAPYEWKKKYFGWSLEEEINFAKIKVLSLDSLSVKDYQKILHSFFISTRDYHVGVIYHSTEMAFLPFSIRSANGKYFFTEVNKQNLLDMQSVDLYRGPLPEIGNQLITLNSIPIAKVIKDIKNECLGNVTSKTAQVLAEPLLTKRLGNRGYDVPQGPVELGYINTNGKKVSSTVEWLYQPEKIANHTYISLKTPISKKKGKKFKGAFANYKMYTATAEVTAPPPFYMSVEEELPFDALDDSIAENSIEKIFGRKPKMMINLLAEALQKDYSAEQKKIIDTYKKQNLASPFVVKATSDTPSVKENATVAIERNSITFGKKVWEEMPKSPFKVHIYQLPTSTAEDKSYRVGYLRISTYAPSQDNTTVNHSVIRLAKSIRYLEQHTDALIVDQVDNPGGYDLYALALASLLTDRPLKLPKNHLKLTQAEIARALHAIESLEDLETSLPDVPATYTSSSFILGYPIDKLFVQNEIAYQNFLISEWNMGKDMSDAYPLSGIEYLLPHPLASYSKPILLLVNSNDFSCGDFFPAILQDNNRAIIFGEQTAGAGGFVERHSYPNSFGIAQFSYTASIAKRLNDDFIENRGVEPDIKRKITVNDLLNGYPDYIKAVNKAVLELIEN